MLFSQELLLFPSQRETRRLKRKQGLLLLFPLPHLSIEFIPPELNFVAHTRASTSDLSDRIKLCAAISCPSWRQITTSLRWGLLIIDDKSWRSFGTPLGTGSLSYVNGKKYCICHAMYHLSKI